MGPVFLLPTATDDLLGGEKWGAGPTAVFLRQSGPWTYGALTNHIWSFAGDDDRQDVNSTFLQPFISYTTPKAWTFALNTESTYNWETEDWSVPINFTVSKLVKVNKQPIQLEGPSPPEPPWHIPIISGQPAALIRIRPATNHGQIA